MWLTASILAWTRGGSPSKIAPFRGKGVFGKDAEIRTHRALHEAKPSECPKGDRDNKSEVYFKNRLFLQAVTPYLPRYGVNLSVVHFVCISAGVYNFVLSEEK